MRLNEILEHLTDTLLTPTHPERQPATPSTLPDWFKAIDQSVSHRMKTLHTVADLAAIAGMSLAHFSRSFHHIIGFTPAAWLRQRRLAAAADLLRSTDLTTENIAQEVGLSNTVFKQGFRKQFGCTPKEWRYRRLGR